MFRRQPLRRWFSGVRREVRANQRLLWLALASAALGQLMGLALPLLAREPIDALSQSNPAAPAAPLPDLPGLLAMVAAFALLRAGLGGLELALGIRFAQAVLHDLRLRLLQAVQRLTPKSLSRRGEGGMVLRFIGDAGALQAWLSRTCVTAVPDVLTLLAVVVSLAFVDPRILAAAVAPTLVVLPLCWGLNRPMRRWSRRMRAAQSRLSSHLLSLLRARQRAAAGPAPPESNGAAHSAHAGSPQVATLPVEAQTRPQDTPHTAPTSSSGVVDQVSATRQAAVRRATLESTQQALVLGGFTLAVGLTGATGALFLQAGSIGPGDLTAAIWLLLLARAPALRLARANVLFQRARVARSRIRALLREARREAQRA